MLLKRILPPPPLLATLALLLTLLAAPLAGRANHIFIPMDETQKEHLKAYGVAFWLLQREVPVDWLLNYRGGSFACEVTAGVDVAHAHALLRCGTPAEHEARPDRRLRLTIGLRRDPDGWTVTHEHHSFVHRD